MRKRAGIIFYKEGAVLLIHRWNEGREYFVFPGGGVEGEETPEQTALREAKEETGLDVELGELFTDYERADAGNGEVQREYYFLAKSFSGEIGFHEAAPERKLESDDNVFRLEWVSIADFPHLVIYPDPLREELFMRRNEL